MTASSFRANSRQRTAAAPELVPDAAAQPQQHEDPVESRNVGMDVDQDNPEEVQAADEPLEDGVEGEPVEEDLSWLQDLKEFKQLHGLELVDLVKALANGQLPDELQDIIKVKLKNGDQEWESPISKARREAMLHHDYTQKLQALSREKEEYHADKDEFIGMLQGWKGDAGALLDGLERLEFPVLEAAKLLAKRHSELAQMTPRERELYDAKQALERELNKNKSEAKRQQKTQSEARAKADGDKMADFVSSTAHDLFKKNSIPVESKTWDLFLKKFQIIAGSYPAGTAWSAEMVSDAFEAMSYDYRAAYGHRTQAQEAANKQPAKQPLVKPEFTSPAREQVAKLKAPAPAQRPGKKGGAMTRADFRKQFIGR